MTDKKSQIGPHFIFSSLVEEKVFRVSVAKKKNDEYGDYLCDISNLSAHTDKKERPWIISSTGFSGISYENQLRYLRFSSREEAATFMYVLKNKVAETVDRNPLTEELMRYLSQRAETLHEEEKKLLTDFFRIRVEQHQLLMFAKKYGVREVLWRTEHTDQEKAVSALLDFKIHVDKEEVLFVSETALYKLIGKEDARTVLALIKNLCNMLAPNVSGQHL
jgi:hypothetical protein